MTAKNPVYVTAEWKRNAHWIECLVKDIVYKILVISGGETKYKIGAPEDE